MRPRGYGKPNQCDLRRMLRQAVVGGEDELPSPVTFAARMRCSSWRESAVGGECGCDGRAVGGGA